ncbi:FkbM family methyltransferase [Candidatus Puniceispirillum sp.]|nr:FkbM family methyltransferase [Candidatus Puniceispirillum sp.]
MIFKKMMRKGLFGILKAIFRKLELSIKAPISRLVQYKEIERLNYTIDFVNEGSIAVKLPKVSLLEVVLGKGVLVKRNIDYMTRPFAEVLLRKTIFELYKSGYINKTLSIIDIGSWISDNSIIWSHYLSEPGKVIAIDPSSANISYGQELARLNKAKNIKFVQAVCADKSGIGLEYDGTIDHASFKIATSENHILSTTIDEIIEKDGSSIGLFHVDVEGFELSVLKGAMSLINRDLPVISFEQHISKEKVSNVTSYLKELDYRVFMVNEVLPGCSLDCRNFLALPSKRGIPKLTNFDQEKGRDLGVFSAVIGDVLIEV